MLYIIKLFFEMVFMTTTVSPYFYTGYGATKSIPLGDESYDDVNSDNYPELFETLFEFVLVGDNGSNDNDNPSEYPGNCEDRDGFSQGNDGDTDSSVYPGENPENCEGHGDFIQGDDYGSDDNANHCEESENCEDHDGFVQVNDDNSSDDDSSDDDSHDDINTCDDLEIFGDYDNFIQVGVSDPHTDANSHFGENGKYAYGDDSLINYASNYHYYALQNSRFPLPYSTKGFDAANLNQEIEESEDFTLIESPKEVAKQQEDDEPYELIRKHSLCCPMESAVARNLRDSPEVQRQFVTM